MSRNFVDPEALFQALHGHFLLDGRDVLDQTQLPGDLGPDGPESILAIGQVDVKSFIDADENDVAADHAQQLFHVAVELVAAAHPP